MPNIYIASAGVDKHPVRVLNGIYVSSPHTWKEISIFSFFMWVNKHQCNFHWDVITMKSSLLGWNLGLIHSEVRGFEAYKDIRCRLELFICYSFNPKVGGNLVAKPFISADIWRLKGPKLQFLCCCWTGCFFFYLWENDSLGGLFSGGEYARSCYFIAANSC